MVETKRDRTVERLQLQQIIAGMTEGIILIDPDGTLSWTNEAALQMHGVEAVQELGRNVEQYANRYKLRYLNNHPVIDGSHPAERVLAGEVFTDLIVEVTPIWKTEPQWVHKVRSLILTDADGDRTCLVLIVADATEHMQAVERFERSFNANPAPALICRISDLRYNRVNRGFLEMTGYTREEVIGRSVYELDIMEAADKRELGKERLADWETVPQMEACLALPGDGTKLVIVAGQPIEIGDEKCMLFTFADLEPRRRAESALRNSEEKFAKTFRLAPVPMKICTLDGFRILDVNDAFIKQSGWQSDEVVGRSPAEIELWEANTTRKKVERDLLETGGFRNYEAKLKMKDGAIVDCLVSAETITIGNEVCVLDVFQDISDRKTSERELVMAIEEAMTDSSWLTQSVLDKLANMRSPQQSNRTRSSVSDLTKREHEILGLMSQGRDDNGIADALHLSRNTVRNHVQRIYGKIDVHRRAEAIVWARERDIVGNGSTRNRDKTSKN